ncbi:BAG domain-containing protein [Mycena indigotica]|uniref:BAG domain-containing protein n=1 Tax=Mycena indigotica TaxID=2126181 RepID=A0A8H6TB49_9AGAR|nr:BAG domain-containing protein [Mycena indigotica]KAF7315530.1 BAG domain-containing protein [Mycena indigotica]
MVNVHWNRERYTFPLPPPETPLKAIREAIANITHLTDFKLIHKGAVMKDPETPISAYHIRETSTITVIEIGQPPVAALKPTPPPPAAVRSEQSVISAIQSELATVRQDLSPAVDKLLLSTQPQPKEHLRLSELLLQALLRLDAISTGEWEEARKERKVAVKEVQELLDRLDSSSRS